MTATDGVLPGDVFGTKAIGVYTPNTGVVAVQGGTATNDSQNPPQPYAPMVVQLGAATALVGVVQLADGTTSTQKLAIDSSGRLTLVPNQVVEIGDGTTPTQKLAIDPSGRLTILSIANALPAGTNTIGGVTAQASATGAYSYSNITTGTTTLVKTGAGTLHAVTINKLIASATIELDDALTHTTPTIGTITIPGTITSDTPFTVIYDIAFTTGLSITTSGATDITVAWK